MKLLSVRGAADVLGVSPGLVYGLCASRRLRHERFGLGRGTIKIPEDAIDEFRALATVKPATDAVPPEARVKLKHLTL